MSITDSTLEKPPKTIPAAYTSVWDGMEITTPCRFDPQTGVLSEIEDAGLPECMLAALQTLDKQYVTANGRQYPVRENGGGELAAERTYGVFVSRNGYCQVKATSAEEAQRIVDEEYKTDDVSWDEDWHPTDAQLEEGGLTYNPCDNSIAIQSSISSEDCACEYTVGDHGFSYRLLDRLRSDCEYYLGNGYRNAKHLWAGNVSDQIAKMRELYDMLPEKPEWLTEVEIDNYEERMAGEPTQDEAVDNAAQRGANGMIATTKSEVRLDVDMRAFEKRYNREYQFLYDNHDRVAGYAEALAEAERFLSEHGDFVGEFARYRGDCLTSDREMVAFILTLNDMLAEMGGELNVDIHGAQY